MSMKGRVHDCSTSKPIFFKAFGIIRKNFGHTYFLTMKRLNYLEYFLNICLFSRMCQNFALSTVNFNRQWWKVTFLCHNFLSHLRFQEYLLTIIERGVCISFSILLHFQLCIPSPWNFSQRVVSIEDDQSSPPLPGGSYITGVRLVSSNISANFLITSSAYIGCSGETPAKLYTFKEELIAN